jgi:hypothetical protein
MPKKKVKLMPPDPYIPPKTADLTGVSRPDLKAQRNYHQRQLNKGLARLSVYVPDADRDAFWDAVDKLRDRWHRMGLPY